ncbi:MAG TPA: helix-turn-helix domain-containing protein [Nocardioides sp.]
MAERPEFLTVPEVMERLRLGRTTVYEQARLYLATGGAEGIPCRRFGRSLRFPAAAFDTTEPVAADHRVEAIEAPRRPAASELFSGRHPARRARRSSASAVQSSLPFAD